MNNDVCRMRRALNLAQKALGETSPNPMVGAVLVDRDGNIIGEGWHHKAGMPHAEVEAIRSAKGADLSGTTLFVTLEPCSTTGRTPPCTEAILNNGIARVVIGCQDPNPNHRGRAVQILQKAGIEVKTGILERECRELNRAFFQWITTGKPYVLLKMAMTLDGKTACENGDSKWVTGATARRRVQELRQWADAVMIGSGTFRSDSPKLTVRDAEGYTTKTPLRIAASSNAALVLPDGWERADVSGENGWETFLKNLGSRNITSLLLEGGGELAASALRAGAVDGIEFHYAPKILGGRNSHTGVDGINPLAMSSALPVDHLKIEKLGDGFSVTGDIHKEPPCLQD